MFNGRTVYFRHCEEHKRRSNFARMWRLLRLRLAMTLAKSIVLIAVLAFGNFMLTGCTPSPRYLGTARPVVHQPVSNEKPQTNSSSAHNAPAAAHSKLAAASTSADIDRDALMGAVNLYLGTPYRYGGTGFDGIDCSAFTQNALYEAGINVPRTSREQYKTGSAVSRPDFGDLVFFGESGKSVEHVGLCLGNNRFAHASTKLGVTIDSLDDPYYKKRYIGAKRVR